MAKTRSMTRKENRDDDASLSFSKKRFKTVDNGDFTPWSDANHDVLFLVMMQLRVFDLIAFSRVCKSWRSIALSNRKTFMASKPPMFICTSREANVDEWCYREDFEGRRFRTIVTHSDARYCIGSTCGYLVLFGRETHDFLLVNPITKHQLHFPDFPLFYVGVSTDRFRTILVYSPSTSSWVFVVSYRCTREILFYTVGKQGWTHVSCDLLISDLHFFKGKIYTLHPDCSLGELRLTRNQKRGWMLLKTKNFPNPYDIWVRTLFKEQLLISSAENLYMIYGYGPYRKVMELDFGEKKWVLPEKTAGDYAVFLRDFKFHVRIKPESWAGLWTQDMFYYKGMWYFPHDCLNDNLLDE